MSDKTSVRQKPTPRRRELTDLAVVRKRRIRDHATESLMQQDSLLANVGAETANLMSLGQKFYGAIEERMARSDELLEEFKKLTPALEQYLKLTRQWERLAQFSHRVANCPRNQNTPKKFHINDAPEDA